MIPEEHQKTVLQYLLFERMLPYNDLADMICRIVGKSDVRLDSIVESLNEKIRRFSQKIVMTNSEISGDKIIVLASTADNADIKSTLSKDQMDFFYHLMDDIINGQGSITFINALNSAPLQTGGRITISEGEKILETFVKKKLLVLENGYLFLSPLAVVELSAYITENYSPGNCILCRKPVILGGLCPHCQVPIHSPCSQAYIGNKRQVRCPQCKGDWSVNQE